jgi:hypothetical protein
VLVTRACPVFFCVTDFAERCDEKEAKYKETNFVKQMVKIVRQRGSGFNSFSWVTHGWVAHRRVAKRGVEPQQNFFVYMVKRGNRPA